MSARLVSPAWLAERLGAPDLRVIEVSAVNDPAVWRAGHVPGAAWWYWKAALWHDSDREFPTPAEMGRRLGRLGVAPDTTVVLYGDPVQYGTYAFWVLTLCGHPDVRLLDGAKIRWVAEGRPLSTEVPAPTPVAYPPEPGDASSRVGRDDVRAGLGRPDRLLLDARAPEEYRGERVMPPPFFDHGAERTGRIPGAVHLYFRELLNEDDTFKPADELRRVLAARGAMPDRPGEIVVYCRLSHRATLLWFAMHHLLGHDNVRVYDGSWTEWGSIVGFPVEK
ncbi:MAG: sulfurtransferase [Candidatus Rokubacteria bacterium RIFCSPHIGHO2_02_FULL_73_26]|nr:MAG: sulfurtransferase [Candidatus Rokubacteria bacterium RIFCSPHIGHO2_02_FULL_73_26]OGL24454.1 MAG: sulfurtransferase [Candidatus Rokubacteria bacterium RIFCSPLOWO2_12_FULL_73_47]